MKTKLGNKRQVISKEELEFYYLDSLLSTVQIANILNSSPRTIQLYLKKYTIPTRSIKQAKMARLIQVSKGETLLPKLRDKEWLYEQYFVKKLSQVTIAKLLECNLGTIQYWMRQHNFKARTISAACKGLFSGKRNSMHGKFGHLNHFYGKSHGAETKRKISTSRLGKATGSSNGSWRGGIAKINVKIRKTTKYKEWRSRVLYMGNYQCQNCKNTKSYSLEVDHLKPLALLIKNNNIKTLSDAYKCNELWAVSNGRVLCRVCHQQTDTWGHRTTKLLK